MFDEQPCGLAGVEAVDEDAQHRLDLGSQVCRHRHRDHLAVWAAEFDVVGEQALASLSFSVTNSREAVIGPVFTQTVIYVITDYFIIYITDDSPRRSL